MSSIITVFGGGFTTEFVLACLLFLIPLAKRERFALRLAGGLFVVLGVMPQLIWLLPGGRMGYTVPILVDYCMGMALFYLCASISVWDAIFGATCAYAVQHITYTIRRFIWAAFAIGERQAVIMEWVVYLCVIALCYFLFARKMTISGKYNVRPREAIMVVALIIPSAFFLSLRAELAFTGTTREGVILFSICRIFGALCCFFVLWVQTSIRTRLYLQYELDTERQLWHKQREHYELSKENIDLINQKCHDLKHQISALRVVDDDEQRESSLREIEQSVMIYDSVVKTGNEVLDVVLTEKSLVCEKQNISWTCMADGSQLEHINPVDLYTIFGNALDNAIEGVRQLTEAGKRVIAVTLYKRKRMAVLQVENYYDRSLTFRDGLPVTTKDNPDYHGYGIKSIRSTVEKYGGTVSIDARDGIFLLGIVIPIP